MDKKTLNILARRAGCFPPDDEKNDQMECCRTDHRAETETLDRKTIELIAVGASVASCCDPCLQYHVRAAREAGAGDAELVTAIKTAKKVRQAAIDTIKEQCEILGI